MTRNEEILETYGGSRALIYFCDLTTLSIDQVNFISCQFFALFLSFFLKSFIKNPMIRLWYCMICGIILCHFCFGSQIFHIIISAGLSYLVIRTLNSSVMPWVVLVVSMCYLSFLHIKRQFFDKSSYALDITGPLMVLTQKVTSLAFSIRDGEEAKRKYRDRDDDHPPTKLQETYAVSEIPDIMTYCSFVFQFQSMLAGPLVLYRDFMDFINTQDTPNAFSVVLRKFTASMVCAVLFLIVGPYFDVQIVRDRDFYDHPSILYQMFFLTVGTTLERCKYYHAWILADAVCNASGLGYDKVKQSWDLVSNVDAVNFELGTSLKQSLDLWNMGTMKWLRHVIYERSPKSIRTTLVYIVSAIWHGFYPGYYITFFSGAIFTYAARAIRRSIRPYFIGQENLKRFYDCLTWFTTRLAIAYATFSFVVQDFYPSWNMYIRLYFFVHILATMTILLVPPIFKALSGSITPQRSRSDVSNGGIRIESSSQLPKVAQNEASAVRNGIITNNMNSLREEDKNRTKSLSKLISTRGLTIFNSIDGNGVPCKLNREIDMKELFLDGNINGNESQTRVNEDEWKNLVISTTAMNGTGTAKLKTG